MEGKLLGELKIELLDTDSANQAIKIVGAMANENEVEWAICGGIAMILYGSDRLTKDIDFIASKRLPLEKEKIAGFLRQGGEHFLVQTDKQAVSVDWILRNDEAKRLFAQALDDARQINNLPVVTPEWLVIMKYIAGRGKDQLDAIFLLSQPDLVNRQTVKANVVKVLGRESWIAFKGGLQRWYDIADNQSHSSANGLRDS